MQDNRQLNHTPNPRVMLSASFLYTHNWWLNFICYLVNPLSPTPPCRPWNHHCHVKYCQQYLTASSLSSLTSLCPLPFYSQYCLTVILLEQKSGLANEFQCPVIDHRIEFKLLPRALMAWGAICLGFVTDWSLPLISLRRRLLTHK